MWAVTHGVSVKDYAQARGAALIAAGSAAAHGVLTSIALMDPHFRPQRRPLPPQTLVELLKHPFCVGEAQRAVLDALGFTYGRTFGDRWEFAEFAQQHQPGLDLFTPPEQLRQP